MLIVYIKEKARYLEVSGLFQLNLKEVVKAKVNWTKGRFLVTNDLCFNLFRKYNILLNISYGKSS